MLPDKVLRDVRSGDEIKEDEMGWACSTHEVVKYKQGFGCENTQRKETNCKTLA